MKTKKLLLTIGKVLLHIAGFPLLAAIVLILNKDVIADGAMYGISVFVSLIVVALMAFVFYLAYFLVRTKKGRSIRNQTVIVAIVVVCCLSGFWMLLDAVAPDPLETATSSTIRWEDLSDNWEARGEVNHQLLVDYVTMNYTLGRLKAPNGETLQDYIDQGPAGNAELAALLATDFEDIDGDGYASFKGPSVDYAQSDRMTIPVLLHLFLDDRSAAQGVNSGYGKVLSIPVPYYYNPAVNAKLDAQVQTATAGMTEEQKADYMAKLPTKDGDNYVLRIYRGFDDVSDDATATPKRAYIVTDDDLNVLDSLSTVYVVYLSNGRYYAAKRSPDDGDMAKITAEDPGETSYFTTQAAAVQYLQDTYNCGDNYYIGYYRMATVGWHVLDMLGEGMQMDMSGLFSEQLMNTDVSFSVVSLGTVGDILATDLLPDAFALIADMLNEPELLGSPLYISLNTATGELALTPSNESRGVLGYMQIAWLNNNPLLYVIVSFFSVRTIFYIYGPIMLLITLALGWMREAGKKLKEQAATAQATEASAAESAPAALQEDNEGSAPADAAAAPAGDSLDGMDFDA